MIRINSFKLKVFHLILYAIPFLMLACGNMETQNRSPDRTYLAVRLEWPSENGSRSFGGSTISDQNICDDYGIDTLSITVFDTEGSIVGQSDWDCISHKGTLTDIPTGSGYKVVANAFVGESKDWEGIREEVVVKEGKNDLKFNMKYIGNDHAPPEILSTRPSTSETNIPLNVSITITLSEPIMHSSIADSSILLKKGSGIIPVRIDHSPQSDTITINPLNNLEKETLFSLFISKDIADCAGNRMESDYSLSFTTSASSNPLNPPSSFNSKPGNESVWLSWGKVSEADSYKVYIHDSKNISTDPGNHTDSISLEETTYHWEGLENNKTYYFIVTSVDKLRESDPSFIVSETPILIPYENDLVAYYDFADGSVEDLSINKNHGIGYDVQPATDLLGNPNGALYFNGKSSHVAVNTLSGFDPGTHTVAIVYKLFDYKENYGLVSRGGETERNFALNIMEDAPSKTAFIHYSYGFLEGSAIKANVTKLYNVKIPVNKYIHATYSIEKNPQNTARPYKLVSYEYTGKILKSTNLPEPYTDSSPLIIGASGGVTLSHYFKGIIDDVIIYKRVLTSAEINNLYKFLLPISTASFSNSAESQLNDESPSSPSNTALPNADPSLHTHNDLEIRYCQ